MTLLAFAPLAALVVFVLAALALGWIVPLVVGLVRLARDTGGRGLIALGCVWGLLVFASAAVVAIASLAIPVGRRSSMVSARAAPVRPFDPERHDGEVGTILLGHEGEAQLVVVDRKTGRQWQLAAADGEAKAPVGRYQVRSYRLVTASSDRRKWHADTYFHGARHPPTLTVEADGPARLDLGPPFKAVVSVSRDKM